MKKYIFYLLLLCFLNSYIGCDTYCERDKILYIQVYDPIILSVEEALENVSFGSMIDISEKGKIYIYKDYIFVNKYNKGFHIFDKSDPSNPVAIGFLTIPGSSDIAIKDDILYTNVYHSLVAINIADVTNPKVDFKNIQKNVFPRYYSETALSDKHSSLDEGVYSLYNYPYDYWADGYIVIEWKKRKDVEERRVRFCEGAEVYPYLTQDGEVEVNIVDFDNRGFFGGIFGGIASSEDMMSLAPFKGAGGTGTAGSMASFLILEDHLYVLTPQRMGLSRIDPSSGLLSQVQFINVGFGIETLFGFNHNLFIGSTNGMYIYDISDVSNPEYVSQLSHFRSCDPVVSDGDYAYVTLRSGTGCGDVERSQLQVVGVEDIQNPELLTIYPLDNPYGLAVQDNTLFVCDGSSGLKILDIADRNNPNLIKEVGDIFAYDIILTYPLAIVISNTGLLIFRYDDLENFKKLKEFRYH